VRGSSGSAVRPGTGVSSTVFSLLRAEGTAGVEALLEDMEGRGCLVGDGAREPGLDEGLDVDGVE
jgi:hypothetical protein